MNVKIKIWNTPDFTFSIKKFKSGVLQILLFSKQCSEYGVLLFFQYKFVIYFYKIKAIEAGVVFTSSIRKLTIFHLKLSESGVLQISFFPLTFKNLEYSRFDFFHWKCKNLEYSRFSSFLWNFQNLEYYRINFFHWKFQNLEYSIFIKYGRER